MSLGGTNQQAERGVLFSPNQRADELGSPEDYSYLRVLPKPQAPASLSFSSLQLCF